MSPNREFGDKEWAAVLALFAPLTPRSPTFDLKQARRRILRSLHRYRHHSFEAAQTTEGDEVEARRQFAGAAEACRDAYEEEFFWEGTDDDTLRRFNQALATLDEMALKAANDADELGAVRAYAGPGRPRLDESLLSMVKTLAQIWHDAGGEVVPGRSDAPGPLGRYLIITAGVVLDHPPTDKQARWWVRKLKATGWRP